MRMRALESVSLRLRSTSGTRWCSGAREALAARRCVPWLTCGRATTSAAGGESTAVLRWLP